MMCLWKLMLFSFHPPIFVPVEIRIPGLRKNPCFCLLLSMLQIGGVQHRLEMQMHVNPDHRSRSVGSMCTNADLHLYPTVYICRCLSLAHCYSTFTCGDIEEYAWLSTYTEMWRKVVRYYPWCTPLSPLPGYNSPLPGYNSLLPGYNSPLPGFSASGYRMFSAIFMISHNVNIIFQRNIFRDSVYSYLHFHMNKGASVIFES